MFRLVRRRASAVFDRVVSEGFILGSFQFPGLSQDLGFSGLGFRV